MSWWNWGTACCTDKAAAGVACSGQPPAPPGPRPCAAGSGPKASRYGTNITTITVATAGALRRTMVPMASASTAATASSAPVPATIRASVSSETGHARPPGPAQQARADGEREGGGDQAGDEADRADHDGLGGKQPAAARRGGQRDADQPAPVLGGDEHRGHHDQRDQPEERPVQRPLEETSASAVLAPDGGADVAGTGHGDRAGALAERAGQSGARSRRRRLRWCPSIR